jgi:N-acetylmuramoyl-L-alanine amidase
MSVHLTPKTFENRKTTKGIRPTTYCLAPTVLSENLFHDTKTHVEFLSTKEGRDAIINSHFNGIEEFFRQMNS